MNIKQFTQRYRENWKELEHLTTMIGKSKKNVTAKSMKQFYQLYQKASQNLSYSQTNFPNEKLTGNVSFTRTGCPFCIPGFQALAIFNTRAASSSIP